MSTLYILVGLPGCGKSTWAENNKEKYNYKIFSSDTYRKNLYGDENDQTHNSDLFKILHNDIINHLKAGKNACYDATNINRKSRRSIIALAEAIPNIKIISIVFLVPIKQVKSQNTQRNKAVPNYVIDKMERRFEIPFIGEGFSEIWKIANNNSLHLYYTDAIFNMINVDQENPHHQYTLDIHCKKCKEYLEDIKCNNLELLLAAELHDYGKLFTKSFDNEKKTTHYFGHECVGAYKVLTEIAMPPVINKAKVAFYINYHMELYRLNKANNNKIEHYKKQFGKEWSNLVLLHEADVAAH